MNSWFRSALMVLLLLAGASAALAQPGNIRYTVHNLSATAPPELNRHQASTTVTEVCVFCHTPHNAVPSRPLWNKVTADSGTAYMMYTSSTTLSSVAKGVTRPGPESLLCLSCHDGRTAINVVHNSTVSSGSAGSEKLLDIGGDVDDGVADPGISLGFYGMFLGGAPQVANLGRTVDANGQTIDYLAGNNFTDDHPISFSYTAAWNEKQTALRDLTAVQSRSSGKIRFYGPENRLECASCHDPHVAYGYGIDFTETGVGDKALRPFLVMSNSGSNLCLACHNK